jgi:hypothetical protein
MTNRKFLLYPMYVPQYLSGPAPMKLYTRAKTANGVIVSICVYCAHKLAAPTRKALRLAERAHNCPLKQEAQGGTTYSAPPHQ